MGVAGWAPGRASGDDGGRPAADGGRDSGDAGVFDAGTAGEATGEGTGDRPGSSNCNGGGLLVAAQGEAGNDRVGRFSPGFEFGGVDRAPLSLLLAVDGRRVSNNASLYACGGADLGLAGVLRDGGANGAASAKSGRGRRSDVVSGCANSAAGFIQMKTTPPPGVCVGVFPTRSSRNRFECSDVVMIFWWRVCIPSTANYWLLFFI
jgi:hypothetical protein